MAKELAEQLAAYLPIDRRIAVARGEALPQSAVGAVLFADISGFTALTESLERELGPRRGSEELTARLNQVYEPLIAEVHGHGGSVIGFSGDAITCWFPLDAGTRAAACGLELLAMLQRSATHGLAIKVSVAAGEVERMVVGDPQRYVLDVARGPPMDRMAAGERMAEPFELVVAPEVRLALGEAAVFGRPLPDGYAVVRAVGAATVKGAWPTPEPEALDEERLRPWLLPPVYETLKSGQTAFLADLRPAAALFVGFSAGADFDPFVRWTQGVLERFGGFLIQLTTGDKGSYLYAAFGAPVALEDTIGRALAAAAQLRSPPRGLLLKAPRLGLSFGRMRAGAYGSELRRTYGVLGDETNVAARLMSLAAPGQVLVTARVASGGAGHYDFGALGEMVVKGKRAPLEIFELREHKAAQQKTHGAIVGRERERELLDGALQRLTASERSTALIEGDPGIGKSQVAAWVAARARELGLPVILADAEAIEAVTPLHAWRRVFGELLQVEGLTDPIQVQAKVAEKLPLLAPYASLLSPVLPVALPAPPQVQALTGDLRTRRMLRLLVQAFGALTKGAPSVLLVEDAHWLDSLSWRLLESVQREAGPLLVAVTSRPAGNHEALERLRRSAGPLALRLKPLRPDDVSALVARRLEVRELPDAVAQMVRTKAEGNPFFAVELGFALRDTGVIEIENEICRVVRPLDGVTFPDTIEGVVTSRIDRLTPAQQLILKVASVLGRSFGDSPLRDLLPVADTKAEMPRLLAEVERLELIEEPEPSQGWLFKHAITHDVAYNLMLFEQRRTLHEAAADWYERARGPDGASLLAHHRVRALEGLDTVALASATKAIAAVLSACKQALQSGAVAEASTWATTARGLLPKLPPTRERSAFELEVCTLMGAALAVVRGPAHEDVRREFRRARELCDELGETSRLFEAVFGQWYSSLTGCDRAGALEFSGQLLTLASAHSDPAMTIVARHARAATAISDGNHAEGLEHLDAVIEGLKRVPVTQAGALAQARNTELMSHCYRAWASWFLGFPDRAVSDAQTAVALARASARPLTLVQALCFAALVHRYRREPHEAEPFTREAAQLAQEHGISYWVSVTEGLDAWMLIERGDFARGVALLERVRAREREAGLLHLGTMTALADTLQGYIELGRFADADAVVSTARTMHETRLMGFGFPEILRLEGFSWWKRGDVARARKCFDDALALAGQQKARSLQLRALLSLSELSRSTGGPVDPRLHPLLSTFTEGHASADLRDARALIS